MVDVLLRTYNKFDLSQIGIPTTLANAGADFNLYHWDNGSKIREKQQLKELIEPFSPKFQHFHDENIGNPKAQNQLLLQTDSEYICFIAPDTILPTNWLSMFLEAAEKAKDPGFFGYLWGYPQDLIPRKIEDVILYEAERVYGTLFFHREILEKVGYLSEEYDTYGLWDSDFNVRAKELGYKSYYLPIQVTHINEDLPFGYKTPYRKKKDAYIEKNTEIFNQQLVEYKEKGYYVAPPKAMEL